MAKGFIQTIRDVQNDQLYRSMLAQAIKDTARYARQGEQQTEAVANTLVGGGMTRLERGDVKNLDRDTVRASVIDNTTAIKELSKLGIFDKQSYATDPMYKTLPGTDYLKQLEKALQMQHATSLVADDYAKASKQRTAETETRWQQLFKDKDNPDEAAQWYNWLMADYLLGNRDELFDFEKINSKYEAMDDATYYAEEDRLRNQFMSLDWETLTGSKTNRYESKTSTYENYLDTVGGELKRRKTIEELEAIAKANPEYASLSVYNDTYTAPERSMFGQDQYAQYVQGLNNLNRFINIGGTYAGKQIAAEHSPTVAGYLNRGYDYMTDDEIATYNVLYNTDQEKAAAYLEALGSDLLYRRAQADREWTETKATNPYLAVPTWIDARINTLGNIGALPLQAYEAATGKDDPYSAAYDAANKAGYVTGAQMEELGDIEGLEWSRVLGKNLAQHLYSGVSSAADNALRAVTGPTGALALAGAQAASGSLQESAGRDEMSGAAKIVKAILTAGAEVGTEKVGLDALFDKGKPGALEYIKGVIEAELGEETINYLSEDVIEAAVAFMFDHEADIKSAPEFWQGLGETALQTLISSGLMGSGGAISQANANRATGKQVKTQGDFDAVLDIAAGMDPSTQSYQLAQEAKSRAGKGKKISLNKMGQIVNALDRDLSAEQSRVVDQVMDAAIVDRLVELGTDAATAKKNAPAVRKIANGQVLTAGEKRAVAWDDNASQVVKELAAKENTDLKRIEVEGAPTAEPEGQRAGQKWKSDLGMKTFEQTREVLGKRSQLADAVSTPAAQDVQKAVEAAGKKTSAKNVKSQNMTNKSVAYVTEAGEAKGEFQRFEIKDGAVHVVVKTGDKESTVKVEDLTDEGGAGTAAIIEYTATAHHNMTAAEANTMMQTYEKTGGNVKKFITDFEAVYTAGYAGIDAPATGLQEAVSGMVYEQAQREAAEAEEKRVERAKAMRKVTRGSVAWLGQVEDNSAIKGAGDQEALSGALEGMTEEQKATVEVVQGLAEELRVNVVLYEGKGNNLGKLANGKYEPSTHTLYIDVNSGAGSTESLKAGKEQHTLGYAMMRTLGHELTHHIESTSAEGYAQYKAAVKKQLQENGQSWAELVRGKIEGAAAEGRKLTRMGAEAEVVADASEYMLQESSFTKKLDSGLYAKVKSFVQSFMEKVREIFTHITGEHRESAALRKVIDGVRQYTDNLQQLWDAALGETIQGASALAEAEGDVTAAVEDAQYSTREKYDFSKSFAEQVDDWTNGSFPERDTLLLGRTPNVLREIGFSDLPMTIDQKHMRYMLGTPKNNDHDLGEDIVKRLPELIADPVAIIANPAPAKGSRAPGVMIILGEKNENANGRRIVGAVSVLENGSINGITIDSTRLETAHSRGDVDKKIADAVQKEQSGGNGVYYINKDALSLLEPGQSQVLGTLGRYGVINSIREDPEFVNSKFLKQTETSQFKRWFGDSKVVNKDGSPKVLYHQTGADFSVFNTDNPVAGANDSETPNGIFFKDNDHDIGIGGRKQMAVYVKAKKLLHFRNREEANLWYRKHVPGYADLHKQLDDALADFEPEFKAIEDEQFDPATSDERVDELFEIEDELIKKLGVVESKYRGELRELLNRYFLTGKSGYDGIELDYDGHRWVNGVRENVHTYIVFSPKQVKSATDNVGTFDPENPDIRYSSRDLPDTISIREYLGAMKPTSRMTETEKDLLGRYQKKLAELQDKERLAAEQDEIIKTAPATSQELLKAKNRYQVYRQQANRIARELARLERAEGFAGIMATSQTMVNEYLSGATGSVADAQDALETEIKGLTDRLKVIGNTVEGTAQGQRNAFARGLFNQTELNLAAKQLKDSYNSRMSVKVIADRLALAYGEIYANKGAEGAKRFANAAKELAQDILDSSRYRYRSEMLSTIAEEVPTISLTETDLQEIKNAGLTVAEYKRGLSPYVKVAEGASDLSSYVSNAEAYGGQIARILGDETEGNLAMALYNVIQAERASEESATLEGMSESASMGMVLADVVSVNLPMSTSDTTLEYLRKELKKYAGENEQAAQSVDAAIKAAKSATARASAVWREAVKAQGIARQAVEYYRALEEQRRLIELQEQKEMLTEQLKTDAAKKLSEKASEMRKEYREREQKARAYRQTREEVNKLRRGIGRKVKRLNALRIRETDQKHVPQELQHVADLVMQTFTDSSLSKLAFAPQQTASFARRYRMLQELESDMTYYWDDEIEQDIDNLQALGEAYTALREREGSVPSSLSLEGVELETEILQGVDAIVSNVMRMIDSENDQFLTQRNETFDAFATQTGEDLIHHADAKVLKGKFGDAQMALDELLRTGNMTPIYFFEQLKNGRIMEVFDQIRKAQTDYARIIRECQDFVQGVKEKHHYGSWTGDAKLTMQTSQKHQITLSREQAMWVYATAKREKSNALYQTEHLMVGGFQYKDTADTGEGKYRATDKPHSLDTADVAKIGEWLTAEQKSYADEVVGFLSTTMADYGNDASMEMFGYKKFLESYYFPFQTAAAQRFQRGDEGASGDNASTGRVKNSGFTKKLQHKANVTLIMDDFTTVAVDHMQKMATYAAMVQPIENMKRLMNHKVMEKDGTINTIRALIGQKYGMPAQKYLQEFLKDLNGAAQGDNRATKGVDFFISAFKRGAVMASASVVLQQPTAMARAMAMVNPKYFVTNPFYRPSKGVWDEMMKHSGTAVIKDMGKFDVGLGLTASEYISDEHLKPWEAYRRLKEESKLKGGVAAYKRFMDWLTAAPGMADQWTWGLIWQAVKKEVAEQNPGVDTSSEAFLDMVGQRFDDVIDHTQVYDSVLTRSNLMRSKNALHKMATSFMSEPTLSINMLYNALTGEHSGRKRAVIIGSVMASQVMAGAMAALVQAWNDDDDERNWAEKYADRATGNIIDNIRPSSMIPYISDIRSMFEGYSVERPDMSVIKDVIDYTSTFFKAFEDGGAPDWKQTENFIGTLANMLGLPAKNISREMRRTWNAITNTDWSAPNAGNVGRAMMENVPFYNSKNSAWYERLAKAMMDGDKELAEDLRTYMLTSKMVKEETINSGVKTALKNLYADGQMDEAEAKRFLTDNGLVEDEDAAYWEVDKWEWMRETGGKAGDWRKYDDFTTAVESGENLKQVVQTYMDNGVTAKTLAAKITEEYKPRMKELYKTNKADFANLQARILTAYQVLGYDRDKKLKDIQGWLED